MGIEGTNELILEVCLFVSSLVAWGGTAPRAGDSDPLNYAIGIGDICWFLSAALIGIHVYQKQPTSQYPQTTLSFVAGFAFLMFIAMIIAFNETQIIGGLGDIVSSVILCGLAYFNYKRWRSADDVDASQESYGRQGGNEV